MGDVSARGGGSAMLSFLMRSSGSSDRGGSVRKWACHPILALYL